MPATKPITVRLADKLRQDGECLTWTGAVRPGGYGVIGGSRDGRNWYDSPHRIDYMLAYGPIPDGLHIDHLCRNRLCCRPDHLEAVTQAENNRRVNHLRWHGDVARLDLSGWVDEADIERGNDDALVGLVVHKRRGHGDPLDQYVTCTVRDLVALLTGERP